MLDRLPVCSRASYLARCCRISSMLKAGASEPCRLDTVEEMLFLRSPREPKLRILRSILGLSTGMDGESSSSLIISVASVLPRPMPRRPRASFSSAVPGRPPLGVFGLLISTGDAGSPVDPRVDGRLSLAVVKLIPESALRVCRDWLDSRFFCGDTSCRSMIAMHSLMMLLAT